MKSKAEVAEALGRLVRTLKLFPVGFEGSHLGNAVAEVVDSLCEEPEPKTDDLCDEPEPKKVVGVPVEEVAYVGEVGPVVPAEDPTDGSKPEYFLWIGRGKDGPSVTFERLLKDDYLTYGGNPLRFAPNSSWRGRRLRVTFTDITDGEPKPTYASWDEAKRTLQQGMALAWQEGYNHRDQRIPGGYANNPYHEKYQGFAKPVAADTPSLAAPESWQEERAALVEECERRRENAKKLRGELDTVTAALKGEQGRAEALAAASARSRAELSECREFISRLTATLGLTSNHISVAIVQRAKECFCAWSEREGLNKEIERLRKELEQAQDGWTSRLQRDVDEAHQWRRDMAKALGFAEGESFGTMLVRAKQGAESLRNAIAGATTWQWQEWGRTIVGGIGDSGLELFEAVKQEVAILLETSRANERNAREARGMLQMVSSSPEAIGRMASAIGRAAEKEGERYAIQEDIMPGPWEAVELESKVPVGSLMCVSRKIVLSFPEDCAGQPIEIRIKKLA